MVYASLPLSAFIIYWTDLRAISSFSSYAWKHTSQTNKYMLKFDWWWWKIAFFFWTCHMTPSPQVKLQILIILRNPVCCKLQRDYITTSVKAAAAADGMFHIWQNGCSSCSNSVNDGFNISRREMEEGRKERRAKYANLFSFLNLKNF